MKQFKVFLAVIAVIFATNSAFKAPLSRLAPPTGYSLYTFAGGNPSLSANWTRISTPNDCPAITGVPCQLQAHPASAGSTKPLQSDLTTINATYTNFDHTYGSSTGLELKIKIAD